MNKTEIVRSVKAERRATLGLLQDLEPTGFDTPTGLPGWRIREVIAHLITTDKASVTGGIIPTVLLSRDTDRLEAWNEKQVPKWANRSVPDLLIGLERWGRRFARLADSIPSGMYRVRVPTPWGRAPGGIAFWVRAYDEWIHRHDIRRTLDLPDEQVDLASIAEFLLNAIGYGTIHLLPQRPAAVAVSFDGVPLPEWGYDLAGRTFGPDLAGGADARIVASAPGFIMAAAGRDRFEDMKTSGLLKIDGDESLAEEFLAKLRIV
jgi:uncharacterized protein (TIGR03083 family)